MLHFSHIPTLDLAKMEAAKVKRKNIFKGAAARLAATNAGCWMETTHYAMRAGGTQF